MINRMTWVHLTTHEIQELTWLCARAQLLYNRGSIGIDPNRLRILQSAAAKLEKLIEASRELDRELAEPAGG